MPLSAKRECMSTHTPGPWMASRVNGVSATVSITAKAGALLADVYHQKNAPLIAAAPDLLAALSDIERWLADGLPLGRNQKTTLAAKARAAIDKATCRAF